MKKKLASFAIAAGLVLTAACNQEEQVKDSPQMREALTKPPKFDINNVPPEHRDKVRQMMGGGGAQSAPGAGGGTPAGGNR